MTTWFLEVQTGPGAGSELPLVEGEQSIGRDTTSEIVIAEKGVSRKHTRITVSAEGCMAEDLGSTNGTWINGTRINAPAPLKAGDVLQVGTEVKLVLKQEVEEEDSDKTMMQPEAQPVKKAADFAPSPKPKSKAAPIVIVLVVLVLCLCVAVAIGAMVWYLRGPELIESGYQPIESFHGILAGWFPTVLR